MVRWKRDALRVALSSLGVAAGGLLLVLGLANLILAARGEEGAPSWKLAAGVTVVGALLFGWPMWLGVRQMLRAKASGES